MGQNPGRGETVNAGSGRGAEAERPEETRCATEGNTGQEDGGEGAGRQGSKKESAD